MGRVFKDSDSTEAKSTLISRNVTVTGRRTSVRLEPEMWASLKDIATREDCSMHDICSLISLRKKRDTSLTAAIRVFVMLYFRASSTEAGHERAGHGNFERMKRRAGVTDVRSMTESAGDDDDEFLRDGGMRDMTVVSVRGESHARV